MDQILSKQKFDEQIIILHGLEQTIKDYGWTIEVAYPDMFCTMHPTKQSDVIFMVRLRCEDYPSRSPSLQFIDPITKKEGAEYWPKKGAAFEAAVKRPGIQLCIPGIREYHEGCHASPSDQNPWNPQKYTFADMLQRVQLLLDEPYA